MKKIEIDKNKTTDTITEIESTKEESYRISRQNMLSKCLEMWNQAL